MPVRRRTIRAMGNDVSGRSLLTTTNSWLHRRCERTADASNQLRDVSVEPSTDLGGPALFGVARLRLNV